MKLGLVGEKLGHSYSAVIHTQFNLLTGLEGSYDLLEIPLEADFRGEILKLADKGFDGVNVTIPYKIKALEISDTCSMEARNIGAANTLLFNKGKIHAANTDYFGFRASLEAGGIEVTGHSFVVLGSGGSSRSVTAVLEDCGASGIQIASRKKRGGRFISYEDIQEGFGLVNTTPVGMYPDLNGCPVNDGIVEKFNAAVDLIYNPAYTKFLKKADSLGLKTANGLFMLVAQAVKAQEIWRKRSYENDLIISIYNILKTRNTRFILTGMSGCGKTTLGMKAASETGLEFIDIDDEIERKYGRISEIFREHGEQVFREYETRELEKACSRNNVVISTGGGILGIKRNQDIITNSIVIYISRPLSEIKKTMDDSNRPMIRNKPGMIERLYNSRKCDYERTMNHKLLNIGSVDQAVGELVKIIQGEISR